MTFGEKLFKLRKEKGLSQEQLAWQVNTTRQAVSKWENDQGFPETEKLMMLGNIFSVSIDYLLKNGGEELQARQQALALQMETLRAEGREKSVKFRELFAQKLTNAAFLSMLQAKGLL